MINHPGNAHPLARDTNTVKVILLDRLRLYDPHGTIRNLALENTPAARRVMDEFRRSSITGCADALLLQAILATIELHQLGITYDLTNDVEEHRPLNGEEKALLSVAMFVYKKRVVAFLIDVYGLDLYEHRAIMGYSSANKGDKLLGTQPNELYMGPSSSIWGPYGDGWKALASALQKLPCLKDLGLEITTYRATREKTESAALKRLEPESNVLHGIYKMNMGQQHYTSTAITYNGHWGRVGGVGGMIAITGCSGVFINPFGIQGFVDGAEILYPPEIITTYEGQNPTGFQEHGLILPVFHLKEVNRPETGQKIVEDQDFAIRRPRGKDLDKRKMALVDLVEEIVGQYGKDVLTRARGESGVKGDMMYLTIDDLVRLCYYLEIAVRDQIEQPQKLALIEKIEAIIAKYGTAVWQKARAATGLNGPVLYLTLEQLNILFNQLQTYIK